jgi:hypothetical protein
MTLVDLKGKFSRYSVPDPSPVSARVAVVTVYSCPTSSSSMLSGITIRNSNRRILPLLLGTEQKNRDVEELADFLAFKFFRGFLRPPPPIHGILWDYIICVTVITINLLTGYLLYLPKYFKLLHPFTIHSK